MKTLSVREIRQRWPAAERALQSHDEVIVTRDGKPIARLLPFEPADRRSRGRVDFGALDRWRSRFWRSQPAQPSTDGELAADRRDGF